MSVDVGLGVEAGPYDPPLGMNSPGGLVDATIAPDATTCAPLLEIDSLGKLVDATVNSLGKLVDATVNKV